MSNRLPWYKHFPADHLVATADLTLAEEGALRRMLDWSWIHGALPNDPDEVAKRIRAPGDVEMVNGLLIRYFTRSDNGYVNDDIERQRAHAEQKRVIRSSAGAAGAAARWGDKSMANAIANGMANAIATPRQKPLYARSGSGSPVGICTDLEDSTGDGGVVVPLSGGES